MTVIVFLIWLLILMPALNSKGSLKKFFMEDGSKLFRLFKI